MVRDNGRGITAEQAAEQLGYHINHIYRMLAQGRIKGRRIGGKVWLFDQREIDRIKALQDDRRRLPRGDRA